MSKSISDIEPIHRPQEDCTGCPFGGPVVGSKGDPTAEIVVVGESPGIKELQERTPLVGPSGNVFHMNMPDGVPLYILNAVECFPKSGLKDEERMTVAAECCHDRLIAQIQKYPRKFIITMGNFATRSVLGTSSLKITKVRGQLFESPLAEHGVMPIIHPAALMRGTGSYKQWQNDIARAFDFARGHDPRTYEEYPWVVVRAQEDRELFVRQMFYPRGGTKIKAASCDIETSGFDHRHDYILQVGVTIDEPQFKRTFIFFPEDLHLLKPYLEDAEIAWCWHNGKFDIKFLRAAGIHARVDDDTMLMSYALNEEGGIHDLDAVAFDVLGAPEHKDMLKPHLKNKKSSYAEVPEDVLTDYLGKDGGKTGQVRLAIADRVMRDSNLRKLYRDTLIPASEYLAQIEMYGALVDQDRIAENDEYYTEQKEIHAERICEIAGYDLNPGSPQQLSRLLYGVLKFPNRFKGSTDANAIDKMRQRFDHPIFDEIVGYRSAVKMNGTYCKGWLKHIHADDGRIHCTYKIHGTRTGRLSSAEPNMQNIPRLGRVRGQVIVPDDCWFVECDLSQAELRILAALSRDPLLVKVYQEGLDLHTDLSMELDPAYEELKNGSAADREKAKEIRIIAKNINFGIVYGITEFGLADQLKVSTEVAKQHLGAWKSRYKVANATINRWRATPIRNQVLTTCFGRKKRVGIVAGGNIGFLQNEAANFPPQSIASDITLTAGIRIWKELQGWGVHIINTVHDSILLEVPKSGGLELLDRTIELVNGTLEQVPIDYGIKTVPFVAEADIGSRWQDMEEYPKWRKQQAA